MFGSLDADKYDRQYSDGYLIRRLAAYFGPYRRQVITVFVLVVLFASTGASFPLLISSAIAAAEANAPGAQVGLIIGALFTVGVIDYFLYRARRRITGEVLGSVISQLRKDAFAAALDRDLAFYDDNKTGKVVSRITSDTQEMNQTSLILTDILNQMIEVIILFVVLVNLDWRLTGVMALMMPAIVGLALIFRHFARIATRQGSRAMAAVNDNIQESVTGISVAKNFRQEAMIYREFTDVNGQSYRINLRRGAVLAMLFPALNAVAGFVIAAVMGLGALAALGGDIDTGTWYLFIQSIDRFLFPFINLASFWSQLQAGLSATERVFALIDADNTVVQHETNPVPPLKGAIAFDNVIFEYKTGERVLDAFDLTIRPGESVAFVGHTGAGKSTIAKLIERFYEFQAGTIRIDGHDIRTFDLQAYRSQLGIVPQQPFLFAGTIRDNIRYANPTIGDAEIDAIAHSVGRGEWLQTLPHGLESEVGERGGRLSMGQRQLVSLLRVLAQKPAIFILDEATASIDPFTEMQIQEALDLILARSTSILIAHRLSTVRSADRIIVLKSGGIIEQGSHNTLMREGGHYAELYNTYFRHQSLDYVENARTLAAAGERTG
jgi:ATP-binding cassette subfamily B protein